LLLKNSKLKGRRQKPKDLMYFKLRIKLKSPLEKIKKIPLKLSTDYCCEIEIVG
jgi:hypothetical protein